MAANKGEDDEKSPVPYNFAKLYLKLLLAKKDYEKAQNFITAEGPRSFDLWVERRQWQLRIFLESDQTEQAINEMIEMIKFNYTQVENDF